MTWTYLPVTDPRSLARLFIAAGQRHVRRGSGLRRARTSAATGTTSSPPTSTTTATSICSWSKYTHNDPREQFYLLLNDGTGHFTEVADAAGVANRGWPLYWKSEGAQAVDFDGDGDLDLFAASHFYFNEGVVDGVPRFVDRRAALGLPLRFDEGLKFLDFDNDGRLDLLLHHPSEGPQLWRFTGEVFVEVPMPADVYDEQLWRQRLRPQRRRIRGHRSSRPALPRGRASS